MSNKILVFILGVTLLVSCQSPSKKTDFGKYYKIGDYNVLIPFGNQPNVSPKQENELCKLYSVQYCYPSPKDDNNFLYGIDICELKTDSLLKDEYSKINFLSNDRKTMYQKIHNGQLIAEKQKEFLGEYAIEQKIKVNIPNFGETYITSIYFLHDNLIIRLFTFTPPENAGNNRIYDYFNSIKFN